ncbi:MAG: methyltransferase domain-containing protein [Flavobacteriaceae bacterium]|nr:methyltransferase domain-containing protein [Flavobacteriaceae bacterium]
MKLFKFILNTVPRPLLIKISLLIRPFLVWWYRGNRYTDPIDGKSYRKFLPYGYENPRENVLAPGTLSLERHRLLWLYLQHETRFFDKTNHLKVLHFAPEQAFHKRFRQFSHWDYTTTDLNSPLADVSADICHLPFADNAFDLIFCSHVLEHIKDDHRAMAELFRVMKPGGFGFFQVPQDTKREKTFEDDTITTAEQRRKAFGQYDHVRIYGMDYFDRLRKAGFEVEAVSYVSKIGEELANTYRLDQNEYLPVCQKPIQSDTV